MRRILAALLLFAAAAGAQSLQSWDGTGNGLLKGAFFFRYVIWVVGNNRGDLSRALSLRGTITFDGNGNYALTCQVTDSQQGSGSCSSTPIPGIYRVSAGGFARIESPLLDLQPVDGLVWNGTLIASSTEPGINDLFIAAQARTDANVGSLNGKFWIGDMDFPAANISTARDSLFALNFDGSGGAGNADATGYIGANGSNVVTQSIAGIRYTFASGVGTLNFGGTLTGQNLIAGSREFFVSQDGNLIFGGLTTGFDMMVGIRAPSGSVSADLFGGLYYQGGLRLDETQLAQNFTNLQTFYSSFLANGTVLVEHRRIFSEASMGAFDYTFSTPYIFTSDGTYEDGKNGFRFVLSDGGGLQLGIGKGPILGLSLAVKPNLTGTGPFINPALIVNAASFAPSTAGVSRGELVTLFGSNLASAAVVDGRFPATLGGVLVLINSKVAPIYEVGPNRITVQIPFSVTESAATIQVITNGMASNSVPLFVRQTTPGVFLIDINNRKYAAALHPDFKLVTPDNPAKPGETLAVYVTGLGDVDPPLAAGIPAPQDPLSKVTSFISGVIDGREGASIYIGLAPDFIGLYQINVTVPAETKAGDVNFGLATPNAYHESALLPVGAP
jgi:uncharacterized protein (TIGR03437 family)